MSAELPDAAAAGSARQLREQFDRSFALAPTLPAAGSVKLLTIRSGGERYAIRLADVRGLYADRRILALPGPMPELLGVTSFRGQIVPVYQLAALLGHPAGAAPRWLVLVQASAPLAFAFEAFEAHICASAAQLIASADGDGRARPCDAVHTDGGALPVLAIGELVAQIEQRAAPRQGRAP